jgi:hypothetical protein
MLEFNDVAPGRMMPDLTFIGTVLDPILVVIRVAEAIAVGISLAKALGWEDEARLGF